jgi:hypothetical protein
MVNFPETKGVGKDWGMFRKSRKSDFRRGPVPLCADRRANGLFALLEQKADLP